jgi:ribosomal protein S18 acetylase RimI-like enzyme
MTKPVHDTLSTIRVTRASLADAAELSVLAIRTYVDTFGSEFEPDELAHYLETTISEACWQDYLAEDGVLLARIGGRSIGYVQFGRGERDGEMVVHRLYVDAPFHGRGIGSDLLRRALGDDMVRGAQVVRIDVWEHNHGARRLYERFGFRHEGELQPFVLESGEIDGYDLILVKRQDDGLTADHLSQRNKL